MTDTTQELLVETNWLAEHLNDPDIAILDASWYLPQDNRNFAAEFAAEHIPGAQFFDIDDIADKSTDLPHMVPTPDEFASALSGMGISNNDHVIVYDTAGLLAAPRVWWTFRLFGHDNVSVLNGGLSKWKREGRSLTNVPTKRPSSTYKAGFIAPLIADMATVSEASSNGTAQIADGRGAPRFRGDAPEPREGLAQGRIPGSFNAFFADLANADGTVKAPNEVRQIFIDAGIDLDRPVITSCGSGITAAVLSFGLELIGHRGHALYDGSFAEWGQPGKGEIETG